MPIVYVRDKNSYEIIRVEESFSSLVWTERYQEAGEFILEIPINVANFDVYKRGNYVQLDESDETMIIESLNINDEVEDPTLEVGGRSLSCILERRINASKILDNYAESIKYEGSIYSIVNDLVTNEITNPKMQEYVWMHKVEDGPDEEGYDRVHPSNNYKQKVSVEAPQRAINNFTYSDTSGVYDVKKNYSKIMSVYDILVSISKKHVTGFRVRLQNGVFVLETYKGVDRTSAQKVLDPVIFNPVMDNISYVNYYEDSKEYKTTGFTYSDSGLNYRLKCGMELSGDSSRLYSGYIWNCGNDKTGLDRYEVPFDIRSDVSVESLAKNIDSEAVDPNPDDDTTEEYTKWVEYYHALENKIDITGDDEFENGDYEIVKTSEGAIDPLVRYAFDKDYFIGDVVELSNDNGIIMTAYIDEVVRSYDEQGFITTPNFKNMTEYDAGEEEA